MPIKTYDVRKATETPIQMQKTAVPAALEPMTEWNKSE